MFVLVLCSDTTAVTSQLQEMEQELGYVVHLAQDSAGESTEVMLKAARRGQWHQPNCHPARLF